MIIHKKRQRKKRGKKIHKTVKAKKTISISRKRQRKKRGKKIHKTVKAKKTISISRKKGFAGHF